MDRILIFSIYFFLTGITGLQKINGDFPPAWFIDQFKGTILNCFPGSLVLCYTVIVGLEILAAFFFLAALIKTEFKTDSVQRFSALGFNTSLFLFTILFFGSFLIKNYENGFMDMGYFVMTLYASNYIKTKKEN